MNIFLASIFFLVGIVFIIISVVIWKFEKLNIINGYNPDRVKDKKGYAKYMGITHMIVAILQFITSIILLFGNLLAMFIPQSIFIVFIIGSTIISKKYYD
jgi:hypothetical protein